MRFLRSRRYGFLGQGQSVMNTAAVAAGFGMLLLGYDQGVMAGLIGSEGTPFSNTFKNPDAATLGIMVAIYEIGCFVGAGFSFFWGENFSRRTCMIWGVLVMFVGAALQTASMNMGQLIAGRVIIGLGNGLNFSTIPTWASEVSGLEERGRVAAFNETTFPVPDETSADNADLFLSLPVLPESPRWLVSQGYDDEAKEVLDWITPRAKDKGTEHLEVVEQTYRSIIQAHDLEKEAEGKFSYAELFHGGAGQNWRRMALCAGIMACQQLSGYTSLFCNSCGQPLLTICLDSINLLTYYISYVLQNSVGLDRHTSLLVGGINGIEYLVAAIIPIWTIERFGRRKLLLLSACGQTISMAILSAALWFITAHEDSPNSRSLGILAVACFFLFNTFYAQGFLAIPFFYPAEITTLRTRSRGVSLSVMSNWIFTFLVVMITPTATSNIGWKTYIIFAVLNLSFIPVIYFFFPGTSGISLEALDYLFDHPGMTRGVLNKEHRKRMLQLSSQEQTTLNEKEDGVWDSKADVVAEVEHR
ncbi:sugar transporter [Colletotrichum sojae]|uniref:Sugar transporter n=1 Tax=Colletotrichum sojae TaxID=2175907 RepID=A0A8H6ILX3_9PEZI|nr:sugar transporter [Colletotrichum sojae]